MVVSSNNPFADILQSEDDGNPATAEAFDLFDPIALGAADAGSKAPHAVDDLLDLADAFGTSEGDAATKTGGSSGNNPFFAVGGGDDDETGGAAFVITQDDPWSTPATQG